jgi:hypothetical protein
LNYTIPKNRQEAIEIFDKLVDNTINQPVDIIITKYYMFIGALTECSDEEFSQQTSNETVLACKMCEDQLDNMTNCFSCANSCHNATKKIFSKRWNE